MKKQKLHFEKHQSLACLTPPGQIYDHTSIIVDSRP